MDKKFFVPFETAKLAKEKGYPQTWADWYYHENIDKTFMLVSNQEVPQGLLNGRQSEFNFEYINAAPTYHEVVDWLYEKKICITCHPAYSYEGQYNGFQYEMQTYDEDDYPDDIYRTREEALNEGILKALEML